MGTKNITLEGLEESKTSSGAKKCCAWRKQYIYNYPVFHWEEFIETRKKLVKKVGENEATKFYEKWISLLDLFDKQKQLKECWYCGYILYRLISENPEWDTNLKSTEKRTRPKLYQKEGVIIQSTSEPNMVCCQIRNEKYEQFRPFIEPRNWEEDLISLEKLEGIREYVKIAYLTCGKEKTPICQTCYDFLEDMTVFLKVAWEEETY